MHYVYLVIFLNFMQTINIFGSTGYIGEKTLKIINNYFPEIKINILLANKNYKKLSKQAKLYKSKYVCLVDNSKYLLLHNELKNTKIRIISPLDINDYIKKSFSDISILSISGYSSLKFIESIIINTQNLGLVNKECIVSAGSIINKLCLKYNTNIFPLDSEHYSIHNYFNKQNKIEYNQIKNVFLTASGGPLLNKTFQNINNIAVSDVNKHPKWKMGFKNTIDSATLVNKCLEIIEAHYLFDIKYEKLKIIIHPEALVHSIIEFYDKTSSLNYFYHDMAIPIFNFLNVNNNKIIKNNKINNYDFKTNISLNFSEPSVSNFPILKIFNKIDKTKCENLIKFNAGNELAIDLFSKNLIIFAQINNIIEKSLLINVDFKINNIQNIMIYKNILINKLKSKLNL